MPPLKTSASPETSGFPHQLMDFSQINPWILALSGITVFVTIWMGFRSAKTSKSASDFFVAGRSVSVGWNA